MTANQMMSSAKAYCNSLVATYRELNFEPCYLAGSFFYNAYYDIDYVGDIDFFVFNRPLFSHLLKLSRVRGRIKEIVGYGSDDAAHSFIVNGFPLPFQFISVPEEALIDRLRSFDYGHASLAMNVQNTAATIQIDGAIRCIESKTLSFNPALKFGEGSFIRYKKFLKRGLIPNKRTEKIMEDYKKMNEAAFL